jgi:hypothetical protein
MLRYSRLAPSALSPCFHPPAATVLQLGGDVLVITWCAR